MNWFRRFMAGRYGTDKLNITLLGIALVLCLVSMFMPFIMVKFGITVISYGLMIFAIFRCFSRNIYKRYQENCRYLNFLKRFKDRQHRYYSGPRCKQSIRVPRGKGKIAITCPKCREKFIKKT